jgi:hypothetical protein
VQWQQDQRRLKLPWKRSLRDKMDAMFTKLSDKIDSATRWTIGLYVALAVAMLGTMARGFGWI